MPDGTRAEAIRVDRAARSFGTAALVLAGRIAGAVMTLGYTLLLTRVMSPAEIGVTFASISVAGLGSVALSLNGEAAAIRFLPLYLETGRPGAAAGYVRWTRRIVGALSAGGAVLLLGWLLWGGAGQAIWPFVLALMAAPWLALARVTARQATALGRVLTGSLPKVLIRPALLLAVIGGAALTEQSLGPALVALLVLLAAGLTCLLQWGLLRPAMGFLADAAPDFQETRQWFALGLMLSPALVMNEYLRDLVIVLSAWHLPPADLAQLGIALSLVGLLNFAVTAPDMVFGPQLSRAVARGDGARQGQLLSLCGAAKLTAVALGVPVAWVCVSVILPALGEGYGGVPMLVLILSATPVAKAVFGPAGVVLNILGLGRAVFWAAVMGGSLLGVATLIGSAVAGVQGAALGAAGAMVTYQAILFGLCWRHGGVDSSVCSAWTQRRRLD